MPQPDSSRNHPWPVDPAAPGRASPRHAPASRRSPEPLKDGRTPDDKDGNEELERKEQEEAPSSRRATSDRQAAANRARGELESEETDEWAGTERFTLEDELEDTWPNVTGRPLDH